MPSLSCLGINYSLMRAAPQSKPPPLETLLWSVARRVVSCKSSSWRPAQLEIVLDTAQRPLVIVTCSDVNVVAGAAKAVAGLNVASCPELVLAETALDSTSSRLTLVAVAGPVVLISRMAAFGIEHS